MLKHFLEHIVSNFRVLSICWMVGNAAAQKTRTENTVALSAVPIRPNLVYAAINLYLEQLESIAIKGRAWMEVIKPMSAAGF